MLREMPSGKTFPKTEGASEAVRRRPLGRACAVGEDTPFGVYDAFGAVRTIHSGKIALLPYAGFGIALFGVLRMVGKSMRVRRKA